MLAAEQGDIRSQIDLGHAYKYGRGVAIDYAEAVKWYRRAAERDDAVAQIAHFNLGDMYRLGKGVKQNYVEAYKWYDLASPLVGGSNRDRLAEKMTSEQIAEAQTLSRQWKPTLKK